MIFHDTKADFRSISAMISVLNVCGLLQLSGLLC